MPGLLRGLARTAAIAGTATAVSNRVSRRQGRRWAAKEQQQYEAEQYQQQAAPPPQYAQPAPPPSAPSRDIASQLKDLAELKNQGILTDAEFQAQKARILGS